LRSEPAGTRIRPPHDFVLDAKGHIFCLVRGSDGAISFVLLNQQGETLRQVLLTIDPQRPLDYSRYAWINDNRLILVLCKPELERSPATAWWLDVNNGELSRIPKWQSLPVVERVVGLPDGGFVTLAYRFLDPCCDGVGSYTAAVSKYGPFGDLQWRMYAETTLTRGTLFAPTDIAVTAKCEIAVLDGSASIIQVFDHRARYLREVRLDSAWRRPPRNPLRIVADVRGGFAVLDINDYIVRMNPDGISRAQFNVKFADQRAVQRVTDMQVAPGGRLWICDGSALMRVNDSGIVDAVVEVVPREEQRDKPQADGRGASANGK
jgi:hypothetical protein